MHPSDSIRGTRSTLLKGKRIVVGVSGSIAAVEMVRVIRELLRHGADVVAVASHEATRILSAEALEFATGEPVVTELTGRVEHVVLFTPGPEKADLLLLAPATANTLSKVAHGIDDTPVTTCASMALGNGVPVVVAPAMHRAMTQNPFVAESLRRLEKAGVSLIPPVEEEGEAKLATPEVVAAHVLHRLAAGPWAGKRVLVIGGSTSEPIDEVRAITNGGSGRLAVEIAAHAYYRGADVTLWMGERKVPVPAFIPTTRFRTVGDLQKLLTSQATLVKRTDVVIVPAAISDFTVRDGKKGKISSETTATLEIPLARAAKILPKIRAMVRARTRLVGFKLEAGASGPQLLERAKARMKEERLDAIVANTVESMGGEETSLHVIREGRDTVDLKGKKTQVAGALLDVLGDGLP